MNIIEKFCVVCFVGWVITTGVRCMADEPLTLICESDWGHRYITTAIRCPAGYEIVGYVK